MLCGQRCQSRAGGHDAAPGRTRQGRRHHLVPTLVFIVRSEHVTRRAVRISHHAEVFLTGPVDDRTFDRLERFSGYEAEAEPAKPQDRYFRLRLRLARCRLRRALWATVASSSKAASDRSSSSRSRGGAPVRGRPAASGWPLPSAWPARAGARGLRGNGTTARSSSSESSPVIGSARPAARPAAAATTRAQTLRLLLGPLPPVGPSADVAGCPLSPCTAARGAGPGFEAVDAGADDVAGHGQVARPQHRAVAGVHDDHARSARRPGGR